MLPQLRDLETWSPAGGDVLKMVGFLEEVPHGGGC